MTNEGAKLRARFLAEYTPSTGSGQALSGQSEIPRFARNDSARARNDSARARNDSVRARNDKRARAFAAVHWAAVALVVRGIAEKQKFLPKLDQFFHALVAAGQQSLARLIAIQYSARPAAESAIAAAWRAGIDLNRAFAIAGAGVELIEAAVVAASGIRRLQQVCPDFLGGEEFNGIGHPNAGQVRMAAQPVASLAVVHGLGASGTFRAARAEMDDGLSPMADTLLHKDVDGIQERFFAALRMTTT